MFWGLNNTNRCQSGSWSTSGLEPCLIDSRNCKYPLLCFWRIEELFMVGLLFFAAWHQFDIWETLWCQFVRKILPQFQDISIGLSWYSEIAKRYFAEQNFPGAATCSLSDLQKVSKVWSFASTHSKSPHPDTCISIILHFFTFTGAILASGRSGCKTTLWTVQNDFLTQDL